MSSYDGNTKTICARQQLRRSLQDPLKIANYRVKQSKLNARRGIDARNRSINNSIAGFDWTEFQDAQSGKSIN